MAIDMANLDESKFVLKFGLEESVNEIGCAAWAKKVGEILWHILVTRDSDRFYNL